MAPDSSLLDITDSKLKKYLAAHPHRLHDAMDLMTQGGDSDLRVY